MENLKYMRQFAESFPEDNWAAAAAQIPWGHNMVILDKIEKQEQRLWYIQQTLENGWSRSMLEMWIESDLYKRQGKAITNFKNIFVSPHSDLAEQTLKDPYNFSFLTLDKKYRERELEQGLMNHLQKFRICICRKTISNQSWEKRLKYRLAFLPSKIALLHNY